MKRSMLARAFTMCMLLVNWALTAGSVYITLIVAIRKERVNDAVPLVPVTAVLTVPAIRALYVGSPPFGIFIGGWVSASSAFVRDRRSCQTRWVSSCR